MINSDNKIQITLIRSKNNSSTELSEIINATNGYLIRNKGAVSDFNLIKDIVDRNIDTVDDEISNQLALPLYLGLMGTMIGIVIGLIFCHLFLVTKHQKVLSVEFLHFLMV